MPGGPALGVPGPGGDPFLGDTDFSGRTPTLDDDPNAVDPDITRQVSTANKGTVQNIYQDANALVDQGYKGQARVIFQEAGAPMDSQIVRDMLAAVDASSDDFDAKPGLFDAFMRGNIDGLIQGGFISQTPYSQALQASGFGFERPEFTAIAPGDQFGSEFAAIRGGFETKDYVIQPQTGWMQYKNGTLVDPNAGFGQAGAVLFDPSSRAPGSQRWATEVVTKWSEDKINEWRDTLVQGGYLSSAESKGPVDATFINAMQTYQTVRYQNGGKPMAIGPVIDAGGGTTPYNFQQIRASIDEDVRGAWESIYGTRPDESEVEAQRDMVIKVAKKLYDKGQLSPEGAASEAEARILGRMERTPEARFINENAEENTQLRDQMLRAVQVTSMMS